MIINLKQFLFEQLDRERQDSKSNINNVIFENFTPRELELKSMSHQEGKLYILEDGKNLIFKKPSGEAISFYLEHSLDELLVNDTIQCTMELCEKIDIHKNDILSEYVGGGALTLHNGVDFQFSTPTYEGKYLLEERSGFKDTILLTRVE